VVPEITWLRPPSNASKTDGVLEGCVAGQGIAALPNLMADAVPALRRLRLDEEPPSKPIFLAMHRDMRAVPRVRAFAEVMAREVALTLGDGKSST
jgi:DNA-binding transcriptional LysR family regulator